MMLRRHIAPLELPPLLLGRKYFSTGQFTSLVGKKLQNGEFCMGFVEFLAVLVSLSERLVERCRAREGSMKFELRLKRGV